MQHDLGGFITVFWKKPLKHMHDEFHRRVVVIQQQHPVEAGLLTLGLVRVMTGFMLSFTLASSCHLPPARAKPKHRHWL
jgi:hypothetical protein